jgi:hypothetical protein
LVQDQRRSQGEVAPMTSEELKKLFARYFEDAQFQIWNKGKTQEMKFVYACENGLFWKFTPEEWWRFVTKVIRNHGCHVFSQSNALRSRPNHIVKGGDNKYYSSDTKMRCVNPLDWTVENWTDELIHTGGGQRESDQLGRKHVEG